MVPSRVRDCNLQKTKIALSVVRRWEIILRENSMRTKLLLGLLFVVGIALVVWANDKIQPLNTKMGLWDMTISSGFSGQMPIPDEVLSKLTPEQQAMIKERMKAAPGSGGVTHAYKTCLTKEKMDNGATFGEDKTCKPTVISSTSSKLVVKVDCQSNGMQGSGTMEYEAVDTENVKGTMHMTMSANGQTRTVNTTIVGKWAGPACGDVK